MDSTLKVVVCLLAALCVLAAAYVSIDCVEKSRNFRVCMHAAYTLDEVNKCVTAMEDE